MHIFYQKNAERFSLSNDEMQKCKIMKATIIETITESIVIEDADDDLIESADLPESGVAGGILAVQEEIPVVETDEIAADGEE